MNIDVPFLIEKARRYGYSVLEDVELVTLCLFGQDASTAIEKSVAMMEGLREVGGPDFLDNVARELQPQGPGAASWHANCVVPAMASVPGLDAHALMVPKGRVSADFIESVKLGDRLVLAIGDAPGYGLKSTFTARFIATMFRRLVEAAHPLNLGDVLSELSRALARQCVLPAGIDAVRRARARRRDHGPRICGASLCNAVLGETRPMRSPARARAAIARRGRGRGRGLRWYEVRHTELQVGDILVIVSDGLTERGRVGGNPYGYRFMQLVEENVRSDRTGALRGHSGRLASVLQG